LLRNPRADSMSRVATQRPLGRCAQDEAYSVVPLSMVLLVPLGGHDELAFGLDHARSATA
jgi:hypothetical protein